MQNLWKDRIPLDAEGLKLLGCALYLGQASRFRFTQKSARQPLISEWDAKWQDLLPIEKYNHLFRFTIEDGNWAQRERADLKFFRHALDASNLKSRSWLTARHLTFTSFQFQWQHLKDCPSLTIQLRFIHNEISKDDFGFDIPISALDGNEFGELFALWREETHHTSTQDYMTEIHPNPGEEYLFALSVADITCPLPKNGPGHPKGRVIRDQFDDALEYGCWYVDNYLGENGKKNAAEAARQAMCHFDVRPSNHGSETAALKRLSDAIRDHVAGRFDE